METNVIIKKDSAVSKVWAFILCVGGTISAGFLAGYFGKSYIGYSGLITPPATPPDMVFAVVWPILYALIGFSLYRIILAPAYSKEQVLLKRLSAALWIAGLIINISWVPLFFISKLYTFTFIWLSLLLGISVTQMIINFKIDKTAAICLIPYVLWLTFAAYLNLFIAILN